MRCRGSSLRLRHGENNPHHGCKISCSVYVSRLLKIMGQRRKITGQKINRKGKCRGRIHYGQYKNLYLRAEEAYTGHDSGRTERIRWEYELLERTCKSARDINWFIFYNRFGYGCRRMEDDRENDRSCADADMKPRHNVALLYFLRMRLGPCVILPCCIIGGIHFGIHGFKPLRIICPVTVPDGYGQLPGLLNLGSGAYVQRGG